MTLHVANINERKIKIFKYIKSLALSSVVSEIFMYNIIYVQDDVQHNS